MPFSDADKAIIASIPKVWPRRSKLTVEQVIEIRRRVDSLTTPWTLADIASDYGVQVKQIVRIARRQRWPGPTNEPDGATWWWRQENDARRERRKTKAQEGTT